MAIPRQRLRHISFPRSSDQEVKPRKLLSNLRRVRGWGRIPHKQVQKLERAFPFLPNNAVIGRQASRTLTSLHNNAINLINHGQTRRQSCYCDRRRLVPYNPRTRSSLLTHSYRPGFRQGHLPKVRRRRRQSRHRRLQVRSWRSGSKGVQLCLPPDRCDQTRQLGGSSKESR